MKKIIIFMSLIIFSFTPVFSDTLMEVIEKVERKEKKGVTGEWTVKDIEYKIKKCKVRDLGDSDSNGNTALHHLVQMKGTSIVIEKLLDKYSKHSEFKTFINREFDVYSDAYPTTALLYCLKEKKYDIAKKLINKGADVNKILRFKDDNSEITPLWFCLIDEKKELLSLLIDKQADVNKKIDINGIKGCTPIYYAVDKKMEDYVNLLVIKGANINKEIHSEELNADITPLWAAIKAKSNNIAKILINGKADLYKTMDNEEYQNCSPLFFCVQDENIELTEAIVDKVCSDNKCDENNCVVNQYVRSKKENYKITPLGLAVWKDNNELMEILLRSKHINSNLALEPVSGSGNTIPPLFLAFRNNNVKAVKHLLNAGADVNFKATYKEKKADGVDVTYSNWTPCLELGKLTVKANVIELFIEKKSDFSIAGTIDYSDKTRYENFTPLFKAIEDNDFTYFQKIKGNTDMSKQKLIYIEDSIKTEYTPLQYAVTREKISEAIINELLDVNSFKEVFIDKGNKKITGDLLLARNDLSEEFVKCVKDLDNEVKLFDAIKENDYEKIHEALIKGKNPNVISKDGKKPLEITFEKARKNNGNSNTTKIFKDLVAHGANINAQTSNGETLLAKFIKDEIGKDVNSNNKDLINLLLESGADPKLPIEYNLPLIPFISKKINTSEKFDWIDLMLGEDIQNSKKIINKPNINEIVNGGEYDGWNALSFAIDNKNNKLAKKLLEKNSNCPRVNDKQKSGKTWLGENIENAIISGWNEDKEEMISILFECGADPSLVIEDNLSLVPYVIKKIGSNSNTEVLQYLFSDDIQNNPKVLYKPNVNQLINEGEYKGLNSLCIAIEYDNSELIEFLIKNGANVDMRLKTDFNTSFTPLGYACLKGKEKSADILLSNKASIDELQEMLEAKKVSILMAACSSLPWSIVKRILDSAPNSIEITDTLGKTAFMYAAEFNKNDPVKTQQLLRNLRGRKANINKKNALGDNSLSLAIKNEQDFTTVKWLLANGVEYKKMITSDELSYYKDKDSEFYTLLGKLNSELSR